MTPGLVVVQLQAQRQQVPEQLFRAHGQAAIGRGAEWFAQPLVAGLQALLVEMVVEQLRAEQQHEGPQQRAR